MKNILCFILILSTEICSSQSISSEQQQQRETVNVVIGAMVAIVSVTAILTVIFASKAHRQQIAEASKFQACVGKAKSEIYSLYGPPNSIVDDAQGQGGTILEYFIAGRIRKYFYLDKDNIVTAVKEDSF